MENENQAIEEHSSELVNYPYAQAMLEEIREEYIVENERENKISNKASAFLALAVAIITVYIPLIPFEKFIVFWNHASKDNKSVFVITILLLATGLVALLVSFIFMLKAYGVKGYRRVKVDDLLTIAGETGNESKEKESHIYQGLVAHYHTILRGTLDEDGNMKINSLSAEEVKKGIIWIILGFILLSVATITLRIIVI